MNKAKSPNPIDVHVGSRVRLRRLLVGMTQEALAERLGLTFQQVQKYEKGTNRISGSRLFQIANVLGVAVQFFFDEMPSNVASVTSGFAEPTGEMSATEFLKTSEGIQLNRSFSQIKDQEVRKQLLDLIKAIVAKDDLLKALGE